MALSSKINVAVLRGGPSDEYDVSMKTGEKVLSLLREMSEQYEPHDIFISKDGEWHRSGLVADPHQALRHTDVVWNALHGKYGEDGQVQKILENLQIPFTGSSTLGSALAMNKDLAKRHYQKHLLLTPEYEIFTKENINEDRLINIFRNYLPPVVIKPVSGGSSIDIRLSHTYGDLKDGMRKLLKHYPQVIVEEFIRGKEATCGVIDNFRGEECYALMPVEIVKSEPNKLFDYKDKYSGKTIEKCPGNFTTNENRLITEMAKQAHKVLGLRHYSRSDFIITPRGKIYILETNSLPGFSEESLFPKSLHATGFHPKNFVDHVIKLALEYR